MDEPICLNGPHCRHIFCPEHAPVTTSVVLELDIEELKKQYPDGTLKSQLDRIELSLFRLSQWLREIDGDYVLPNDLIEIGHKLDRSLRGE